MVAVPITHGMLVTNSRVGIKDDDTCMFCYQKKKKKNNCSFVYCCNVINTFWDAVVTNIRFMLPLSVFSKLYGHFEENENFTIINQLLIIARRCIV